MQEPLKLQYLLNKTKKNKLSRTLKKQKGLYTHTCVSASEEGIDLKLLRQFPSRMKYLLREY